MYFEEVRARYGVRSIMMGDDQSIEMGDGQSICGFLRWNHGLYGVQKGRIWNIYYCNVG